MVLADSCKGDVGWRHLLVTGWAFMECLLFGGLIYGWGSVVFVLKHETIYADLCPSNNSQPIVFNNWSYLDTSSLNSTIDENQTSSDVAGDVKVRCTAQDSNMSLCFTVGSALFCVGCALLGHVNYKFGTRTTRIISIILFSAGTLLLAFVSTDHPWLMFPGLSLMSIGGIAVLVTNTQVSNLFLVGSSSVIGLLCGGFDMSSAVMLMVKIAHEHGFSRRHMFLVITGLHSLVFVSTFLFLPKGVIKKEEENDMNNAEIPKKPAIPSLKSCLTEPMFITHTVWLCLLQLRFYYFIGTLNQYLNRVLHEDESKVSYFTNVCFYTMMSGLVTSFFSGIVYDWQKQLCKDAKSRTYQEVMPAVLPLSIAIILSILLSILVLIPFTELLYLIFIIMTLYRSFLYSLGASFLSVNFPSEYFGVLYGVMLVCGGLFGALQFAFFKWSEAYIGGSLHADIFLLCMVGLACVHPLYLWLKCWKEENKYKVDCTIAMCNNCIYDTCNTE